ncbi:MAG: phosphoglycerate mutase (2,3-diphosphoglycerate-independent) [Xanthomonadales bacterium]|nr:phosphoglycerate mutase (2,3-diphosphoglycerate-independent) [Xanthomonadales bacterium]
MERRTPLLLLILDGWGVREAAPDNAIAAGNTPNWDRLWRECPHSLLQTSGEAVGLPAGQMGNSEVGHMNIGAGRIVYQELTRITRAIEEGEFDANPALTDAIDGAGDGTVHVMGLLSDGGVHSHEDHFLATIALAARRHEGSVAVHVFLDGRDTPPRSARDSLARLQRRVDELDGVRVASVSGRYWAMDRDQRWDRIERAWNAIVHARAEFAADDAIAALDAAYARGENDEFVQPTVIADGKKMEDGDSAIFINFRADRARQLSRALVDPEFDHFERQRPKLAAFATMTQYESDLDARVAFPPTRMEHLFGEVLADAGLAQLRIAETEKYAHVTYFFNGGREQVFEGEDRKLIPSPDVATYDLQPEMSAPALTRELVAAIGAGKWPVIVCNVANPDMVGHSGIFDAAVEAVEAVDRLLGEVRKAVAEAGGEMLVTADHGNVEQMSDPETGQPHTAHTTNPVPLVFVGRSARMEDEGSLRDIAPTMLDLLGIEIPGEMTGRPLVHLESRDGSNRRRSGAATENAVG